jgi:hypothetical protein
MITSNPGSGRCQPTHRLSIRPVQSVIELGAVTDVIHTALNAAHHANRHGDLNDRIAIALPGVHIRRGVARPGHEVVLFGSEAALRTYLKLDGLQTLHRRNMVKELELHEALSEPGEPGTAYVRDRSMARRSPGAIRRARERATRRGIQMPGEIEARSLDVSVLALHFGSAVVHVREVEAEVHDEPLHVSTYGFSSPGMPAVLPIRADRAIYRSDDAA